MSFIELTADSQGGFRHLKLSEKVKFRVQRKWIFQLALRVSWNNDQAPAVQRMDNAIHWINHYPVDSVVCVSNTYPLDKSLSSG